MTPEEKLKALGLALPPAPKPMANYVPFRLDGHIYPGRARDRCPTTSRSRSKP